MQVVVTWERLGPASEESDRVVRELQECFSGLSWVKPLSNVVFYVLRVPSEERRQQLKDDLVAVCETNEGKVRLLVSPAFPDGRWGGWLPHSAWEKLRQRTGPHTK